MYMCTHICKWIHILDVFFSLMQLSKVFRYPLPCCQEKLLFFRILANVHVHACAYICACAPAHLHLDVIRRVGQPLAALASFCGMGTMRDMSTLVFIVPQISLLKGVLTSCLELANICLPSRLSPNPLFPITSQALPQWYA